MNQPLAMPLDIRLINATSTVLIAVFAILVAGALVTWALRAPWFSILGIVVTGEVSRNNALTLKANVAPRLAGSFFTLDLARAKQAFESVPWIRAAVVKREFPNRLRVNLKEHQAVAYWGPESESRLVNSFGEVFEANVDEVEQDVLPRLHGPDGQAAHNTIKAGIVSFGNLARSVHGEHHLVRKPVGKEVHPGSHDKSDRHTTRPPQRPSQGNQQNRQQCHQKGCLKCIHWCPRLMGVQQLSISWIIMISV